MSDGSDAAAGVVSQERRQRLKKLLRQKVKRSRSFPLSFAQQRLWLLDQLDPGNPLYNVPLVLRLSGPVDVDNLNRTLNEVVARHETLRTRIEVIDDEAVQVIEPSTPQQFTLVDLEHLDAAEREAEALARAAAEVKKPFRLDQCPLYRALLIRLGPTEHVLVVVLHHIISDDWSMWVLFREVAMLYQAFRTGQPSPLGKPATQYADYAVWQRQRLQGDRLQKLLDYWRPRLQGVAPLELPTDRPYTLSGQQTGATEHATLPSALAKQLAELGRREGATLYMTLLAAFQVLLHRYSGQDDIAVGSPIAGRTGKETEDMVGFFVNTLVMRADLAGNPTFRDLLRQVRQAALEAFDHQELPFERLVEALNPDRESNRHPLFQVMFTLQGAPWPAMKLADISLSVVAFDTGTSKFDLSFVAREERDGLSVAAEYDSHLFRSDTIERMLSHFRVLLEGIVADPDRPVAELPLLTEAESRQLLVEWNRTQVQYPQRDGLHQFFEELAANTPDAVAAVFEGQRLTYGQLNARANQLASYLQERGVGPEVLVGLCMQRSLEMAVAILGVMKAGGAYLPLDPDYPRERLDFIVADSRPAVILMTSDWPTRFLPRAAQAVCVDTEQEQISNESEANLPCQTNPDSAIYVIYTSGSTGLPKGTVNIHRGLCNKILWEIEFLGLDHTDRVLFKTPLSFDVSAVEFFRGLLCGGGIVIARPGGHRDPGYMAELIARECVTTVEFVPALLRAFLEEEHVARCGSLRRVTSGGEMLSPELVNLFFQRLDIPLYNLYGPTETSIGITGWKCRRNDQHVTVPIGRPISNVRLYILDANRNPVPVGVPGELYIGGVAVGRGYLNRPELDAERFVPDLFSDIPGDRLYKTGDCCRYLPDGNIEFLGQRDEQVKIRGFRIELGEIEAVLKQAPGVRDAVVIARESTPGNKFLAAYVVPQPGVEICAQGLEDVLRARLPEYMVPAATVMMDALPLLPSGKVNRRAFPAVEDKRPELASAYVAPRSDLERQLAEIWQEVLHADRVGIQDNFFALGGHSLLAAQVVLRVARRLHIELPLREMFQTPTIAGLAQYLEAVRTHGTTSRQPIPPAPRDGQLPPSFTQEALWVLDQLEPDLPTYTAYPHLRIRGPLDVPVLERALNEIVRRHEALRTRFPEADGRPIQVIDPPAPRPLPVVDLSHLSAAEQESECKRYTTQETGRPIDLQNGPLTRVSLLRLSADEHVLLAAAHHIVYDGWSLAVLTRELTALYQAYQAGRPSPLPELPIQYADFAAWQRNWLQGEKLEQLRSRWVERLAGVPPLELPIDRPRPAIRTTPGDTLPCDLSPDLSAAVNEFCRREGVTPFMTLLAAFQVLLARYTGQDDFAIGSPVANRTQPETESLIGYFINVVVLRNDLSGDPDFREVVRRVQPGCARCL